MSIVLHDFHLQLPRRSPPRSSSSSLLLPLLLLTSAAISVSTVDGRKLHLHTPLVREKNVRIFRHSAAKIPSFFQDPHMNFIEDPINSNIDFSHAIPGPDGIACVERRKTVDITETDQLKECFVQVRHSNMNSVDTPLPQVNWHP